MSFETEAELSLAVPRSELRNVRQQIEDGIGTVEVGISDGASMSAQSTRSDGGRGGQARRSMRLAESRNEYLDDISLYLEDIEDKVGGGGGGGVGGLATEIFGVAGETAGDAAITAGETVADTVKDVLTGAASTALGNTISEAISNSDVAVEDTAVPVKPNPLPVSGGGRGGTTVSPTFNPNFSPDFTTELSPEFDLPDLKFGDAPGTVRVDESQLPLPVEDATLAVEDTTLPVEDVGPIRVDYTATPPDSSSSESRDLRSFREVLADAGGDAAEGALIGGTGGAVAGSVAGGVGAVPGAALGGLTGGAGAFGLEFVQAGAARIDNAANSGSNQRNGSLATSVENNVNADVRPNITINIDTRQLLDDVEQAIEDANAEVRQDLLDEIEQVANDLDEIERDISRRGR